MPSKRRFSPIRLNTKRRIKRETIRKIHYLFITFYFSSGKSSGDGARYRECSRVCLSSTVVNEANVYISIVKFPMWHLIREVAQRLNSGLQNTLLV